MAEPATAPRHDVGVGLISVGWMGKLHSRAYQALPYVYPETGIGPAGARRRHRRRPGRLRHRRPRLRQGQHDYREVLADPEVDVVSICAPNMLHREIGVAAAEAGKPFWIEKPVGPDVEETAAVAAAANAAGLVTSIGFNYRHAPAVEHSRELVASGALGRSPTSGRCSSPATPPSPRGRCRGASTASWPAAAPSATCSATWST
jgi:predicted dehydrogenase